MWQAAAVWRRRYSQFQTDIKGELRQSQVLNSHLCDIALSRQLISHFCPSVPVTSRCKMNERVDHFNIYLEWECLWWYTLLLKTFSEEVTTLQIYTQVFICGIHSGRIKELENIK